MVNVKATAYKRIFSINRHIADTIIKLDSNRRLPKSPKDKKSAVNNSKDVPQTNAIDLSRSTAIDSVKKRDTSRKPLKPTDTIPIRKSTVLDTTRKGSDLDTEIKDVADSVYNDLKTGISYRVGNARVSYGDFELDAEFIRIDRKKKLIFASGMRDRRTGRYIGRPISKQGKDEPIISDSLLFNYETKKGHIWNISTQQDGNYISKGQAKKLNDEEIALANVIFSACDKPTHGEDPDYGIVITKGIAEQKRIISGPAYLMIEGIPLPIGVPFGFFPKTNSRTSGILLPTFGEDATLGFFLRDFGYYIGLSDYADLTNLATYYSNGSYEVSSALDYMKRYKYNGNLVLSYGSHNYTLPGDPPARDFHINWQHSQNPAASPGSTFSASVNAGTSSFYQNNPASNGYNLQTLTQNLLRSSIAYSRTWAGTPFNLTSSLSHSQDLTKKTVTLELPNINFSMTSINPFDSKDRVDEQKWYQKITMAYTMQATNQLNNIPESELFKSETLTKRMRNGVQHQIPIGINFNLLRYFQFSGSVNYEDRWSFQTINKRYARADSLVTDTVPGFARRGNYNLSASMSTKIYGLLNFKNSKLLAIRHVMTPSVGFSYSPDYSGLNRSYNRLIVSNATVPYPVVYQRYSIFDNAVYPSPTGGKSAGISLSLDNNLEAKLRPRSTDTVQENRKIQLLQSLAFSTFYNFAADSFKLSPIGISGHVGLFKDKINVSFNGTLDPYVTRVYDSIANGQIQPYRRQINRYSWQDGKFPKLVNVSFSVSGTLNPAAFHPSAINNNSAANGLTLANATPIQRQSLAMLNGDPSAYIDFNIPWNLVINYNFSYTNAYVSSQRTNTIMLSGDLNLTKAWKIQFNTNYDFVAGQLSSATSFAIYRDLHCWDLSIQWLPFGYYKSYNVTLRVKSAILQALKLSKRSDYTSNANFNQ
jgi:hypothetical protein